ncbi:MAG TPA: polyprenyl diphosphate synthase [Steroidobacteraceae bacterium]|jgi:undecaprenyl diphosphate synthase|nr:polyprenyl diphosphate synthase [Steroidobacteraceae bacterium]
MHVAIIMDGNGRWATRRGLPRTAGHVEGAKAVRATVEAAVRAGIETLTLYAFSAANWQRPRGEVDGLMFLFRRYLFTETRRCIDESIRLNVIGRRDRLDESLLRAIQHSEQLTAGGTRMHLRIAVDYSSQFSLLAAARRSRRLANVTAQDFRRLLNEVDHSAVEAPDVDLLIRTGGEQRLSDFLLWECAYAELHFTDCLWPDFDEAQFQRALEDYAGRARRFGRVNSEAQ